MRFDFTLTGLTPLLMHPDDVVLSDLLKAWRSDPKNKNLSVPGDDRSPAWTWKTNCYNDGEFLGVPSDNLMRSLGLAASGIKIKGNKTFKSESQSGLLIPELYLPLLVDGKPIEVKAIEAIDNDSPFDSHAAAVKELGFSLFVKRAKVNNSKHVRVRPRFDKWQLKGSVEVTLPEITADVLRMMFDLAGNLKGLCDWRPSSPKAPGPFGRFKAELKEVK